METLNIIIIIGDSPEVKQSVAGGSITFGGIWITEKYNVHYKRRTNKKRNILKETLYKKKKKNCLLFAIFGVIV